MVRKTILDSMNPRCLCQGLDNNRDRGASVNEQGLVCLFCNFQVQCGFWSIREASGAATGIARSKIVFIFNAYQMFML
jgi:hypothetical protein